MEPKPNRLTNPFPRNRVALTLCILATIACGLLSRKYPNGLPQALGKYPGDALWSMMAYWLWAWFKPAAPPIRIASSAFLISVVDELSQLIQTPWLNALRHTTVGHLVLGTVFSYEDILAYAAGILIAVVVDIFYVLFKNVINYSKSFLSSQMRS